MRCKKVDRLLSDYLDGAVSEKTAIKLEKHLRDCFQCRLTLSLFRKINKEIKSFLISEPSSEYWTNYWPRLKKKIEKSQAEKRPEYSSKKVWKWSLAAAGSGLILILVLVFLPERRPSEQIVYPFSSEQVIAGVIQEIEENNQLKEYFDWLVLAEIGEEMEQVSYFNKYESLVDFYSLFNQLTLEEKEIFSSQLIKEIQSKEVENET
ncbi:MAG: anti-sigma factor family protein [Candidatus Aminicenantia bacterium]